MSADRPILLCIIQFQDQLQAQEMTVQDAVEQAARYQVQGIELRRELWPTYEAEIEPTARLLRERDLMVVYATFSRLFAADEAAQQLLLHDIETAARLGSPLLRIFQGELPAADDAAAWDRAWQAIAAAESAGIRLALENFGGPPGHRAADIRLVLDRFDSPFLVTNVDIGNYFAHGEDIDAALDLLGPDIAYVHLKDMPGQEGVPPQPLGSGAMPMAHILDRLDALPQTMAYCLEVGGEDQPHDRIRQSLDYLAARSAGESA